MFKIQEISDVMMAFPAEVSHLMPDLKSIPDDFWKLDSTRKWEKLFSDIFFGNQNGKSLVLQHKEGIDGRLAYRHISAIMGSFEPKHEDKIAAVAYLFNEWFADYAWAEIKNSTPKVLFQE